MREEGRGRGAGARRGRPRSRKGTGPESVSNILGSAFSALGIEARLREYRVKKLWKECVGEGVARRAAPARLIGKTLHCNVSSTAWAAELTYQKTQILKKMNSLLGEKDAVTAIAFKYGPVEAAPEAPEIIPPRELTAEEKKEIEGLVSTLTDPELRSILKKAIEKSKIHG